MIKSPEDQWEIVDIQDNKPHELPHDTVRDDPLTGEDNATSVWFGTGKIDGQPATLLVTVTRDLSSIKTLYDPVYANIDIYRLMPQSGFGTPYIFLPVIQRRTAKKYVNTECALADELHVPVRAEYEEQCRLSVPQN